MAALADAKALPPNFGSCLQQGPRRRQRLRDRQADANERIKIAPQDELALIISQMHGIESAYVLYDTRHQVGPEPREDHHRLGRASSRPARAQLDEAQVSSIRHLVAGAIAGLKPENVTVTDLNGRTYHGGPRRRRQRRRQPLPRAEAELRAGPARPRSSTPCAIIPNVTVEPSVMLDHERISRSKKIKHDPKTDRPCTETRRPRRGPSEGGGPGRPAGLSVAAAQRRRHASAAAQRPARARKTKNRSAKRSASPRGEEIEKESVGLTPKRVTVSVGVPSSYFEKVWHERNPAEEGEEPKTPDQAALDADPPGRDRPRSRSTWPRCCRRPKASPTRPSWSP